MLIALTGQLSSASFALSSAPSGTGSEITPAFPSSSISKTSGQIDGHNPQPIQVSLSTIAFIFFPPVILLTKLVCHHKGNIIQ
ncbi:hypothetical protein D3C73_1450690 [compost metagenome]